MGEGMIRIRDAFEIGWPEEVLVVGLNDSMGACEQQYSLCDGLFFPQLFDMVEKYISETS
jgi:hypothetical protein